MGKYIDRKPPCCILANPLKYDVTKIIEQNPGKPRSGICGDQGNRDRGSRFQAGLHPVDGSCIDEAHAELDCL